MENFLNFILFKSIEWSMKLIQFIELSIVPKLFIKMDCEILKGFYIFLFKLFTRNLTFLQIFISPY
jgi:hypothetical protein